MANLSDFVYTSMKFLPDGKINELFDIIKWFQDQTQEAQAETLRTLNDMGAMQLTLTAQNNTINELTKIIEQQARTLKSAVHALMQSGKSEEEISSILSISLDEVKSYLND